MKKKILYLLVFSMILLGFNNNVKAEEENFLDNVDDAGTGGVGGCIDHQLCGNQNFIMLETKVTHMDNNGIDPPYATYYFTNNKSMANGKNIIYVEGMTKTAYDYGTAATQLNEYLTANDYAVAKQLLANSGITEFVGSVNGKDAYGLITEPYLQYKDGDRLVKDTIKNMLTTGSVLNRNRLVSYLTQLSTGVYGKELGTLLEYINGFTNAECQTMSAAILSGYNNGCGLNIIDISNLLKILRKNSVPSCPGGAMNLSSPTPTCDEKIGGVTVEYAYTATGGGQSNIHRLYGFDQNAPSTGAYCKLFCQEEGTAVLPGALADSVQLGSYIVWPTSSSNTTNKFPKADNYPLKFSGKKTCKLVLMPDHDNFPGNGCLQDPVAEYICIYNASGVTGSKYQCSREEYQSIYNVGLNVRDYAGVNYERVRTANGNYFNESGYCGTEKSTLKTLSWEGPYSGKATQYKVEATAQYYNSNSYGKNNYQQYNDLVQKINKAAENAKSSCENISEHEKSLYERSEPDDECTECSGRTDEQGNCLGVSRTYRCWSNEAMNAKEKVRACLNAKDQYSNIVHTTDEIENNMATCRSYINDFNYARNILNEIGLCGNFSASGEDYYHFSSTASMSYKNGDYEVSGSLPKEQSASITCGDGCEGLSFKEKPDYTSFYTMDNPAILASKVSSIENRTIVFTAETDVYSSNSNYSYINKSTNKYSKNKSNSNYLEINTIGGGLAKVLPTDYNIDIIDSNKDAIQYTMKLQNVSFGESNRFTVTDSGDYVCKYEMAKKSDGCICPQDTKMAGKDLMGYVIEEPISCADAQIKYCDNNDEKKSDKPLFCPDMKTPLTACLKTGIGYNRCVQLVCTDEYKCKNTNGLRTGMDITDCVQTKRAQGLSLDQALNYCDSVVCPIGKTIIYRTIKLENPFPSMDADNTITQKNLKVHMFNNNVKGRYPGANWNGILTVYNKIRNNRSGRTEKNADAIVNNNSATTGTTIYQTKEPLYTFVLNGVTIKSIRDYNDKQTEGYNDFKLSCNKNNSAACISSFVHDARYGLVSGKCVDVDNRSGSFYTCMNN